MQPIVGIILCLLLYCVFSAWIFWYGYVLCFILVVCCGNEVGAIETPGNQMEHSDNRADLPLVSVTDVTYYLGAKVLRQYMGQTADTTVTYTHGRTTRLTHTEAFPHHRNLQRGKTLAPNRPVHQEHQKTSKDTNMNMNQWLGMTSAVCQAWLNRK